MKSKIDEVIEWVILQYGFISQNEVIKILEQLRPYVELGEATYNDFNLIENSSGYEVAKRGYNQIQLIYHIQQIKEQKG